MKPVYRIGVPSSRLNFVARRTSCASATCVDPHDARLTTCDKSYLHAPSFRRPASIVRNRRHVFNGPNFNSRCGQRPDRRLASRSRSTDSHFYSSDPMIARHIGSVTGSLLRREWSAFARPAKTQRARTLPREHIPGLVADGHNGVIEGRLNVHHAKRHVFAFLLLEGLFLALLLRRRCAARCCWFCHS